MTTPFRPVVVRRRAPRARAAQVAGVIGVIVCVILALVVWLGRGAVGGALDGLATTVDGGLDRAVTAVQAVSTRINDAATQVGSIATDSDALVGSAADSGAVARLTARLAGFADTYRSIRTRYADARADLTSAVTSLQQVARLIPGERVPDGAGDRLVAVDQKLQAFDDRLTSAWSSLSGGQAGAAAAAALSQQAHDLQTRLTDLGTAVDGLVSEIQGVQVRAASTLDGLQTILLIAAIAVTLFFVWVLVLNLALWQLGRRWEQDAAVASGPSAAAAAPAADATVPPATVPPATAPPATTPADPPAIPADPVVKPTTQPAAEPVEPGP